MAIKGLKIAQDNSGPEQQHPNSPQSDRFKSVNELCRIPKKNPAIVNGLCTPSCVVYTAQPTSKELVSVTNPSSILSTLSQTRCLKKRDNAQKRIQTLLHGADRTPKVTDGWYQFGSYRWCSGVE